MNSEINKEIVSYIALFFDGEGCVRIYKKKLALRTHIINTNLDILTRIKSVFKGSICVSNEASETRKKSWTWYISDRNNQKFFLETILPYSTVKRSQILDGLEFLKNTTIIKYSKGGMSSEERKYREMMYLKLQEPKHRIYTQEEIDNFQKHIDNTKQSQEVLNEFDEYVYAGLCAFFDAEGSVGAYENKRRSNDLNLTINISNTYPPILIGIKQVFGGNVNLHIKSKKHPKWRQLWFWKTQARNDVKFFLTKILPYSVVKRHQIKLGLKFLETDNYNTKLLIAKELERLKNEEYTIEQENKLYRQIENMIPNKGQHKLSDYL